MTFSVCGKYDAGPTFGEHFDNAGDAMQWAKDTLGTWSGYVEVTEWFNECDSKVIARFTNEVDSDE